MPEKQNVRLLDEGRAFADLSFWRKTGVGGEDAWRWLNDLVSADLGGIESGRARRSLLLSPTGRIRAEFTVARLPDRFLLLQDPSQPRPVLDLLSPYVLSSDVGLEDVTDRLALFSLPGGTEPAGIDGATLLSPSCLGRGVDLLIPVDRHRDVLARLSSWLALASGDDVEGWRVLAGIPRFGVDALEEDLPQEGGLADAVALEKGCYLGQEAVAKVRNLGHPRRIVLHVASDGPVSPGDVIEADGSEVGQVTSAVETAGGAVALARVRWEARHVPLRTSPGSELRPVDGRTA